jgi:hypothetical protein
MANARLAKDAAMTGGGAYGGKENVSPPSRCYQAAGDDDGRVGPRGTSSIDDNDGGGEKSSTTPTSLLDAIFNKQPVSLRVPSRPSSPNHELCGEECDCADPIIEIIDHEDASVFDVNVDEELADSTDDESVMNSRRTAFKLEDNVEEARSSDHEKNAALGDESDEDESVVLLTRTPKKKVFIIDSDEEDGSDGLDNNDDSSSIIEDDQHHDDLDEPEDGLGENNDESSKSISTYGISSTSSRRTSNRLRNSTPKSEDLDFIDSDGDESEKEWLEISSSEEDNISPPKRPNTIVILSDDEEETESDNDDDDDKQSAFTISDDSDSSPGSDYSSVHKKRGRGPRPTSGGRATRKMSNNSQRNNSKSTFRKDRNAITSRTFSKFNKLAFNSKLSSVEVNWSNKLNTTAGITRMRGKLGEKNAHTRVATIELATKVIDDEDRLRATLLHEMCHAAQWLVDGVHKPPHGSHFKKWAALSTRVIGDVEVTTTHDYQIVYKYAWVREVQELNLVVYFVLVYDRVLMRLNSFCVRI